jgi:hypothetical protein
MKVTSSERLIYGPRKYAGLHLLLCRWLRLYGAQGTAYSYVTLGGTELRDIHSLRFIDEALTTTVCSYEIDRNKHGLAQTTATEFIPFSIDLTVLHGSFFSYIRISDRPHIFFLDLPGICAWSDYDAQFAEMFQQETIREGDCLLITSHLGHNPGIHKIREHFSGELAVLGIDSSDDAQVKRLFRRSHPTMTLFKALCLKSIQSELHLRCFGIVKYHDEKRTPMGIYGYAVSAGSTELSRLVADAGTHYFDVNEGRLCQSCDF